jgi:hypothetical protein
MSFHETEFGDGSVFRTQEVLKGNDIWPFKLGTSDDLTWANNSTGVPAIDLSSCLCTNLEGWGPFNDQFRFTPCFIDGVVLQVPNVLVLLVGLYQLYVLAGRKPRGGSSDMKWSGWLKMVCIVIFGRDEV